MIDIWYMYSWRVEISSYPLGQDPNTNPPGQRDQTVFWYQPNMVWNMISISILIYISTYLHLSTSTVSTYIYLHVYIYICNHIYVIIYICNYIYTDILLIKTLQKTAPTCKKRLDLGRVWPSNLAPVTPTWQSNSMWLNM